MKADEMFEELGYELKDEKICPHSYVYIKKYDFSIKEIVLEKAKHLITICYYKIGTDGRITTINSIEYHLSMQELQAINEKVKELRLGKQLNKEIKSIKEK